MEYVLNVCEKIFQDYFQAYQQEISQAYQKLNQLALIQENQQVNQQTPIQEKQQVNQQTPIQEKQQVNQQMPIQENQQVNQQASIQENQQVNQQAAIQENQQVNQQVSIQSNLQKNLRSILNNFYADINIFELIRPDDDHNNPNTCRVNEAIGEDFKKWNNIEPVFIDAPTGSGKTSFVYEKLIPDAISKGCGVLIVSNRIALSRQQKLEVYDIVTDPKYKHFLKDYNLEDLKREEIDNDTYMIGPVCVVTYQSLYRLFNPDVSAEMALGFYSLKLSNAEELRKWSRTIRYAVFDEIQILYADAEFNSYCSEFLRSIPFVFRDVVRVYMTATSYEVIDYIRKYEICKYSINVQNPPKAQFMDQRYIRSFNWIEHGQNVKMPAFTKLIRYTIDPDYSRYELKFFYPERKKKGSEQSNNSDDNKATAAINVLKQIEPSENNKVIVFVDNKKVGVQICRRLRSDKVTAAFLTKDSSDPKTVRDNIINNACFDESVLVTTQVLDSGVNICDESVKNILIFYTDRTQFIQSLGRRRLVNGEDSVTVWAYVPSAYSFRVIADEYRKSAESAIKLLNAYNNGPGYEPLNLAQKHLTDRHCEIFKEFKCDSYPDYAYMFRSIYYDRPKPSTLIYPDYNATIKTDIYVLGVILGKIEYLEQFTYPDKNGIIKDYRQEVGNWLGKPNVLDEIEEKQKEEHKEQSEVLKDKLNKLLMDNLNTSFPNRKFAKIHREIVEAYEKVFPERVDSKRSEKSKDEMGAKSLNKWLEELGSEYTLNVNYNDANDRSIEKRIWRIEKKDNMSSGPEV